MKDVYYLGKLRIPQGTKFFGTVSVLHSENRVNVRFHRLLLPWVEERHCQAVAHTLDGSGGIKGKVNRHWFRKSFSILGKTVLSGLTLFTVPNRQNAFSIDDQLRLTAASNLAQEGSRELDTLRIEKSITVTGGIMIRIIFLESL
jgi:type IV secretory pathway VirB10-like protein